MSASRHPVPVNRTTPPARAERAVDPRVAAVARRVMPTVATTSGALVASLAAERAMARLVTVALGRAGQAVASTPFGVLAPGLRRPSLLDAQRIVVTETTIVERISRRR